MSFQNYGELKASVASWLDRADLEARIPDFIHLGERKIFTELRTRHNEHWAQFTINTAPVASSIPVPASLNEVKTLAHCGRPLKRITESQFLRYQYEQPSVGTPRYFARLANDYYFYPKSDDPENCTVDLLYWSDDTLVSPADEETSTVLTHYPQLELYGALLQATAYLIGDERLQVWGAQYAEALALVNEDGYDEEVSGGPTTMNSIYSDGSEY